MRLYLKTLLVITVCLFYWGGPNVCADSSVNWEEGYPALPDEHGFAGGYAGVVSRGDERWLLFAGGANFPAKDPFQEAVPKTYHDVVYKLRLKGTGLSPDGQWELCQETLPEKLAYGASVTLPERGSVLFIGGMRSEGDGSYVSNAVYEVILGESGSLSFSKLADLPVAVSATSACLLEDKVYVFSGVGKEGEVQGAWSLDIASENASDWQWFEIAWPQYESGVDARARGHHVTGVRDGKLYVFGGRAKQVAGDARVHPDDINSIYGTDDFRDAYAFTPGAQGGAWKRIADLPYAISAAPANAVQAGASHLLLMGGVNLELLQSIMGRKDEIGLNELGHGFSHPGFSRDILAYHTITNTWSKQGEIPAEYRSPVTAPVVSYNGDFVILSGEWSPKLRTSGMLHGAIESKKAAFGVVNWIVVVVYLLGMVGIGYWFMRREAASSTDDYFRGGQRVPWWVAGLSIFATLLSSITFMAIPALSYASNWNKWVGQWPILLIVPLVVFAYLPFFRGLNITSAYEYLEARFNLMVRLLASAAFMIFHIGRIAIVLYLPALALSSVTNIPIIVAIVMIGVLCVIYTVMGGIEAVVWTDAIQAVVLLGGALGCFFLVVFNVDGGFGAITETLSRQEKFISLDWGSFDISSKTNSGWMFFFGFFFAMLPSYTSSQDVVQRYVTTSSYKEASRSLWVNILMSMVGSAIFFALGTALYVFYKQAPEKLDPSMMSTDGILPFFIMQNLPVGVAGVIIAGVFAAAQSTVSSSLNSVAAAFVTDFYGRVFKPQSSDHQRLNVARNVVIILGALGIGVAIWVAKSNVKSAFDAFNTFIGFILGPLAAMFALGIFVKRVGGVACLLAGLLGTISVAVLKHFNDAGVVDVWPLLNGMVCFIVTFVSGCVLGLIFKSETKIELTIYGKRGSSAD
ncbi:N-acetylneuraminate epimerase [Rubritalea halochordaticola]|uniref:N-acetylneuraminate epimerase n=1 Tax=Rubritalea halochordaticola TaxID=714537 RepID=A0ABP9UXZ7_9BACT